MSETQRPAGAGVVEEAEDAVTGIVRLPVFLALMLSLSSCALYWDQFGSELQLYDGPAREANEVSTIDLGAGCYTCVETIRRFGEEDPIHAVSQPGWEPVGSGLSRPNKFIVLPGKYLLTLRFADATASTGYVDLKPGHTYQVRNDLSSDFNDAFVWMEDADTGAVLLGTKKD